jgi:hypothetical protein
MGLQVATSFVTPQGFSVSSVYIRIRQVILALQGSTASATVFYGASLSREKRTAAPLTVPAMPTSVVFEAPLADCIRYEVVYAYIRRALESRTFVCTTVLEEGQTLVEYSIPAPVDVSGTVMDVSGASQQSSESTQPTPQTPPQPEEPPAASPEPQPQPSSEYAPAPAETEA